MFSFQVLAVFCLTVAAATAAGVATTCKPGQDANFDSVEVFIGDQECTTSPCNLVRGQVARCLITFTTVEGVDLLDQRINATVLGAGITTPFPVPNAKQGCDKLQDGAYCPLDSGETATIELAFEVQKIYPKVSLDLAIFLLDQLGNEVSCFRLLGNVVDLNN